jgi:hypothetical protein
LIKHWSEQSACAKWPLIAFFFFFSVFLYSTAQVTFLPGKVVLGIWNLACSPQFPKYCTLQNKSYIPTSPTAKIYSILTYPPGSDTCGKIFAAKGKDCFRIENVKGKRNR